MIIWENSVRLEKLGVNNWFTTTSGSRNYSFRKTLPDFFDLKFSIILFCLQPRSQGLSLTRLFCSFVIIFLNLLHVYLCLFVLLSSRLNVFNNRPLIQKQTCRPEHETLYQYEAIFAHNYWYPISLSASKSRLLYCHLFSSCEEFVSVTGMKCSYRKIFQPAYRDLGWKNWDLGNRASPPFHMNTSKIYERI